jgi:hypothetical protein
MFWGRLGAVTVMIALIQGHRHTSVIEYLKNRCWWGKLVEPSE